MEPPCGLFYEGILESFFWENGEIINLTTLLQDFGWDGKRSAYAINNNGYIAGGAHGFKTPLPTSIHQAISQSPQQQRCPRFLSFGLFKKETRPQIEFGTGHLRPRRNCNSIPGMTCRDRLYRPSRSDTCHRKYKHLCC